ncbi:hypothetical protein AGMMS49940_24260 [Spirochaetia bacterium]|nr:hypothetical protein AGMMS49940_24260 [Spirochaetia bacterium]
MNGAKEMKDLTHAEYEVLDERRGRRRTQRGPRVKYFFPYRIPPIAELSQPMQVL